jgi:hypothetical protein
VISKRRTGIRIRNKGGDPEISSACVRFARWLRTEVAFPVRVPVYLYPSSQITTIHGEKVSASFFAPWDATVEPFIRIATGDYRDLKARRGRDNALAAFLCSLAHEVIHYQTWVSNGTTSEKGIGRKSAAMVRRYAKAVDRP